MSTTTITFVLVCSLAVLLPACGGNEDPQPSAGGGDTLAFQDGERPFGGFGVSSGQPSKIRIQEIAPNVAKVVSFRGADENKDFDEAAVVAEAGGTFESIPFAKANMKAMLSDPEERKKAYAAFEVAMGNTSKMTWFHCGSGNRVGALWALYRAEVEKKPIEEAIADGKTAGLTKLEPLVREILEAK